VLVAMHRVRVEVRGRVRGVGFPLVVRQARSGDGLGAQSRTAAWKWKPKAREPRSRKSRTSAQVRHTLASRVSIRAGAGKPSSRLRGPVIMREPRITTFADRLRASSSTPFRPAR
jgi:hypothetical protein